MINITNFSRGVTPRGFTISMIACGKGFMVKVNSPYSKDYATRVYDTREDALVHISYLWDIFSRPSAGKCILED